MALKQRPLVAPDPRRGIQPIGGNDQRGRHPVVMRGHISERREGTFQDKAARCVLRRKLDDNRAAQRTAHQDDFPFLDSRTIRQEGTRGPRILQNSLDRGYAVASAVTSVVEGKRGYAQIILKVLQESA